MNVAAYELRSNYFEENGDSEVAQHQVRTLFKMFNDPGLDQVVGETKGLVPLNREALDEGLWKALPKSRVVLGYSQPFEAADGTLEQLREIASEGYRLALSGNLSTECLETFSHPSHTLVVNVTDYKPDELQDRVAGLREFKSTITAAGVDTYDDLEFCKALQFDYYQGHFLFKPAVKRQSIPVNRLTMLRLLSKLHDPRIQISEVEKLVAQDVALSYKILRYTNSAFVALRRQVSSAGHAVRLVGLEMVRTWSSALLLSSVDNKPRELMTSALIRARMCELLGETMGTSEEESFLSAGLFSLLDALLDCSMEQALSELPLSENIKSALTKGSGPIGQALRCTIAYEQADWDNVEFYGLPSSAIREKYMAAVVWARQINGGLLK